MGHLMGRPFCSRNGQAGRQALLSVESPGLALFSGGSYGWLRETFKPLGPPVRNTAEKRRRHRVLRGGRRTRGPTIRYCAPQSPGSCIAVVQ